MIVFLSIIGNLLLIIIAIVYSILLAQITDRKYIIKYLKLII